MRFHVDCGRPAKRLFGKTVEEMDAHIWILLEHPIHAAQVIAVLVRDHRMLDRLGVDLYEVQVFKQQDRIAAGIA